MSDLEGNIPAELARKRDETEFGSFQIAIKEERPEKTVEPNPSLAKLSHPTPDFDVADDKRIGARHRRSRRVSPAEPDTDDLSNQSTLQQHRAGRIRNLHSDHLVGEKYRDQSKDDGQKISESRTSRPILLEVDESVTKPVTINIDSKQDLSTAIVPYIEINSDVTKGDEPPKKDHKDETLTGVGTAFTSSIAEGTVHQCLAEKEVSISIAEPPQCESGPTTEEQVSIDVKPSLHSDFAAEKTDKLNSKNPLSQSVKDKKSVNAFSSGKDSIEAKSDRAANNQDEKQEVSEEPTSMEQKNDGQHQTSVKRRGSDVDTTKEQLHSVDPDRLSLDSFDGELEIFVQEITQTMLVDEKTSLSLDKESGEDTQTAKDKKNNATDSTTVPSKNSQSGAVLSLTDEKTDKKKDLKAEDGTVNTATGLACAKNKRNETKEAHLSVPVITSEKEILSLAFNVIGKDKLEPSEQQDISVTEKCEDAAELSTTGVFGPDKESSAGKELVSKALGTAQSQLQRSEEIKSLQANLSTESIHQQNLPSDSNVTATTEELNSSEKQTVQDPEKSTEIVSKESHQHKASENTADQPSGASIVDATEQAKITKKDIESLAQSVRVAKLAKVVEEYEPVTTETTEQAKVTKQDMRLLAEKAKVAELSKLMDKPTTEIKLNEQQQNKAMKGQEDKRTSTSPEEARKTRFNCKENQSQENPKKNTRTWSTRTATDFTRAGYKVNSPTNPSQAKSQKVLTHEVRVAEALKHTNKSKSDSIPISDSKEQSKISKKDIDYLAKTVHVSHLAKVAEEAKPVKESEQAKVTKEDMDFLVGHMRVAELSKLAEPSTAETRTETKADFKKGVAKGNVSKGRPLSPDKRSSRTRAISTVKKNPTSAGMPVEKNTSISESAHLDKCADSGVPHRPKSKEKEMLDTRKSMKAKQQIVSKVPNKTKQDTFSSVPSAQTNKTKQKNVMSELIGESQANETKREADPTKTVVVPEQKRVEQDTTNDSVAIKTSNKEKQKIDTEPFEASKLSKTTQDTVTTEIVLTSNATLPKQEHVGKNLVDTTERFKLKAETQLSKPAPKPGKKEKNEVTKPILSEHLKTDPEAAVTERRLPLEQGKAKLDVARMDPRPTQNTSKMCSVSTKTKHEDANSQFMSNSSTESRKIQQTVEALEKNKIDIAITKPDTNVTKEAKEAGSNKLASKLLRNRIGLRKENLVTADENDQKSKANGTKKASSLESDEIVAGESHNKVMSVSNSLTRDTREHKLETERNVKEHTTEQRTKGKKLEAIQLKVEDRGTKVSARSDGRVSANEINKKDETNFSSVKERTKTAISENDVVNSKLSVICAEKSQLTDDQNVSTTNTGSISRKIWNDVNQQQSIASTISWKDRCSKITSSLDTSVISTSAVTAAKAEVTTLATTATPVTAKTSKITTTKRVREDEEGTRQIFVRKQPYQKEFSKAFMSPKSASFEKGVSGKSLVAGEMTIKKMKEDPTNTQIAKGSDETESEENGDLGIHNKAQKFEDATAHLLSYDRNSDDVARDLKNKPARTLEETFVLRKNRRNQMHMDGLITSRPPLTSPLILENLSDDSDRTMFDPALLRRKVQAKSDKSFKETASQAAKETTVTGNAELVDFSTDFPNVKTNEHNLPQQQSTKGVENSFFATQNVKETPIESKTIGESDAHDMPGTVSKGLDVEKVGPDTSDEQTGTAAIADIISKDLLSKAMSSTDERRAEIAPETTRKIRPIFKGWSRDVELSPSKKHSSQDEIICTKMSTSAPERPSWLKSSSERMQSNVKCGTPENRMDLKSSLGSLSDILPGTNRSSKKSGIMTNMSTKTTSDQLITFSNSTDDKKLHTSCDLSTNKQKLPEGLLNESKLKWKSPEYTISEDKENKSTFHLIHERFAPTHLYTEGEMQHSKRVAFNLPSEDKTTCVSKKEALKSVLCTDGAKGEIGPAYRENLAYVVQSIQPDFSPNALRIPYDPTDDAKIDSASESVQKEVIKVSKEVSEGGSQESLTEIVCEKQNQKETHLEKIDHLNVPAAILPENQAFFCAIKECSSESVYSENSVGGYTGTSVSVEIQSIKKAHLAEEIISATKKDGIENEKNADYSATRSISLPSENKDKGMADEVSAQNTACKEFGISWYIPQEKIKQSQSEEEQRQQALGESRKGLSQEAVSESFQKLTGGNSKRQEQLMSTETLDTDGAGSVSQPTKEKEMIEQSNWSTPYVKLTETSELEINESVSTEGPQDDYKDWYRTSSMENAALSSEEQVTGSNREEAQISSDSDQVKESTTGETECTGTFSNESVETVTEDEENAKDSELEIITAETNTTGMKDKTTNDSLVDTGRDKPKGEDMERTETVSKDQTGEKTYFNENLSEEQNPQEYQTLVSDDIACNVESAILSERLEEIPADRQVITERIPVEDTAISESTEKYPAGEESGLDTDGTESEMEMERSLSEDEEQMTDSEDEEGGENDNTLFVFGHLPTGGYETITEESEQETSSVEESQSQEKTYFITGNERVPTETEIEQMLKYIFSTDEGTNVDRRRALTLTREALNAEQTERDDSDTSLYLSFQSCSESTTEESERDSGEDLDRDEREVFANMDISPIEFVNLVEMIEEAMVDVQEPSAEVSPPDESSTEVIAPNGIETTSELIQPVEKHMSSERRCSRSFFFSVCLLLAAVATLMFHLLYGEFTTSILEAIQPEPEVIEEPSLFWKVIDVVLPPE